MNQTAPSCPYGLVGLVQHLRSILRCFSKSQISISWELFPELVLCITVMSISNTPHPQIFPLGKLFSGFCTSEFCYQYFQVLCGRVISGNVWLPVIRCALLKVLCRKGFLKRRRISSFPKEFPCPHQGWDASGMPGLMLPLQWPPGALPTASHFSSRLKSCTTTRKNGIPCNLLFQTVMTT